MDNPFAWEDSSVLQTEQERRKQTRYPCCQTLSGHLMVPRLGRVHATSFCDVSRSGIGMIVEREIASGTIAALSMEDLRRGFSYSTLIHVSAATADPEGGWRVSCVFGRRLSKDLRCALSA